MTGRTHGGVRGARFSSDGERHRERIVGPRSMRPGALAIRRGSAASFHTHEIERTSSLETRDSRAEFEAAPIRESAQRHAARTTGKTRASIAARSIRAHDVIEERLRTREFVECTIEARHRGRVFGGRAFVIALAAHCAKRLIDIARRFDEALRGPGFS
ncbi:TPA: hypothetical protein QDC51_002565 [Burkholderia multivorans]|nr:hypothetical protein [Burkholderia multivorans]MBU9395824.1 hypothetical protein [Burkholderia multivorans]HDR9835769.1 hypothetical protein [Burkholderia multivorans]